ncbi:MAG: ribosomal protein S18-alanine N-acetyltransferase [Elusimicrobiaceae bacterium]|nr:ribosomal protein S18-alanine N-acetyltransferase [Elusimicrobiaceae bacterium]
MIILAQAHHAADLAEIEAQQPNAAGWKRQGFEGELAQSCSQIYCACSNHKIIGFLALRSAGGFAEILNVAVEINFTRQGVGFSLLSYALDRLKEQAVNQVTLEVAQDNKPAVSLYKKAGLQILGQRKDFYGAGKNAFIMGLNL